MFSDTDHLIRYLRHEAEKYKEIYEKRPLPTGETRIDLLAHQCADWLRKLDNENIELKSKLKEMELERDNNRRLNAQALL